jgi:hypothetical protein
MTRILLIILICVSQIVFLACGGAETGENQNTAGNAIQKLDPKDLPPEFSGEPIKPSAETTPGIPAPGEANKVPKGATPTPGIPDPATLGKPAKPGLTPTPGIPSPEEIKKMMEAQRGKANTNGNARP